MKAIRVRAARKRYVWIFRRKYRRVCLHANGKLVIFAYQTTSMNRGSILMRCSHLPLEQRLQFLHPPSHCVRFLVNGWQSQGKCEWGEKKKQRKREKSLHNKYFIWYLYMCWANFCYLYVVLFITSNIEYAIWNVPWIRYDARRRGVCKRNSFAARGRERNGPRVSLLHFRRYVFGYCQRASTLKLTHSAYIYDSLRIFIILLLLLLSLLALYMYAWWKLRIACVFCVFTECEKDSYRCIYVQMHIYKKIPSA